MIRCRVFLLLNVASFLQYFWPVREDFRSITITQIAMGRSHWSLWCSSPIREFYLLLSSCTNKASSIQCYVGASLALYTRSQTRICLERSFRCGSDPTSLRYLEHSFRRPWFCGSWPPPVSHKCLDSILRIYVNRYFISRIIKAHIPGRNLLLQYIPHSCLFKFIFDLGQGRWCARERSPVITTIQFFITIQY